MCMFLDYVEGSGTMHEIFNYTLESFSETEVHLHRKYINSTFNEPGVFMSVDFYLTLPPGGSARFSVQPSHNTALTPPTIDIRLPPPISQKLPLSAQNIVRVRVVTSETSLASFSSDALFLPQQDASTRSISSALAALSMNITEEVGTRA